MSKDKKKDGSKGKSVAPKTKNKEKKQDVSIKKSNLGGDNVVQPFQLESSNLRGRILKLGSVLQDILDPHEYPNHILHLVAESLSITGLLSTMISYKGTFSLQARGDGPVSMLISDMTAGGEIRACAYFDEQRAQDAISQLSVLKSTESSQNHLAQLLGQGYLSFNVEKGKEGEFHQGIVELKGSSITDCVQHYFTQSEQIMTGIKIAVGKRDGVWRAGAIMLQNLPEEGEGESDGNDPIMGNLDEDDWRRAMILMGSCSEDELLDKDLHHNDLLIRLFHEEGVRVYDALELTKGCRCHQEKIITMLHSMSQADREYMNVDGNIVMRCEFCSHDFSFCAKELEKDIKSKAQQKSVD